MKEALLLRAAIRFQAPELLLNHCKGCPIRETAKGMFAPLAKTSKHLLVRQLNEDAVRVLGRISELGENLPSSTSPHHSLSILQLDELAEQLQNYVQAFRILLCQD